MVNWTGVARRTAGAAGKAGSKGGGSTFPSGAGLGVVCGIAALIAVPSIAYSYGEASATARQEAAQPSHSRPWDEPSMSTAKFVPIEGDGVVPLHLSPVVPVHVTPVSVPAVPLPQVVTVYLPAPSAVVVQGSGTAPRAAAATKAPRQAAAPKASQPSTTVTVTQTQSTSTTAKGTTTTKNSTSTKTTTKG